MPDSPVHAQNLTREERIAALERVRDDQGGTENKTFKLEQVKETLLDVRTWLIVLTTMLSEWLFICFRVILSYQPTQLASRMAASAIVCCFDRQSSCLQPNVGILSVSNQIVRSFGYTYVSIHGWNLGETRI